MTPLYLIRVLFSLSLGITAAALVLGMFPLSLRASTLLNPDCSLVQGVFIEAFLTTFLVFTIIVLTVERTKVFLFGLRFCRSALSRS